jgi:hypothetical protein
MTMSQTHVARRSLLSCSFPRAHRQKDRAETSFDSAFNYEHHLVACSTNVTDVCRADLAPKKEF